jgi:hypothetical protein
MPWGLGFWSLITFTLQMAMIIIGGYAVATSGPVARLVTRLARIPKSPRRAVAFVAGVAIFDRDRLLKRYKNLSAVDFAVGAPLPLATRHLVSRPARRADAGWTAQALRS